MPLGRILLDGSERSDGSGQDVTVAEHAALITLGAAKMTDGVRGSAVMTNTHMELQEETGTGK